MTIGKAAAGVVIAAALAGCAGQMAGAPNAWYGAHNAVAPGPDRLVVCHAFGCARRTSVKLTRRDLNRLKRILRAGYRSPERERKAIGRAIAWAEKRVAPAVGSANDIGGLDMHNAGVAGQMDCLDEATNTTSVLLIAQRHGYLKHHRVASPVARGFFLDGRYPHATAVIVEKKSGSGYAVDSWPHGNGIEPDIMPLDAWFAASPASG
ncbi:hypothetical protein GGD81_001182 [Rhodobium orientis]|uniref:Uncharacterized protein n=1 Tax=Rhodobium orientis TaxID=34017 RepID=A0A327JQU4_9HYPH|nr:hypothetical protein [Rhodobium orientis]MBB4302155.1 hypothetical protein [Rhodobium orientis]MBK5948866.1 hypothetical protein [Rhodobium orientis]RAI27946.1 hypothetical protein CH339_08570 [Rhodobium orientis]